MPVTGNADSDGRIRRRHPDRFSDVLFADHAGRAWTWLLIQSCQVIFGKLFTPLASRLDGERERGGYGLISPSDVRGTTRARGIRHSQAFGSRDSRSGSLRAGSEGSNATARFAIATISTT